MNVEIGTEAAQFPEKEYITGVFLAVRIAIDTYCERDSLIESCIRFIFTSTDV